MTFCHFEILPNKFILFTSLLGKLPCIALLLPRHKTLWYGLQLRKLSLILAIDEGKANTIAHKIGRTAISRLCASEPIVTRGPRGLFLDSPETFRAYFGWHNSPYVFATPRFWAIKLCNPLGFSYIKNMLKDQLSKKSGLPFGNWLFGTEKFSGLSRNRTLCLFVLVNIVKYPLKLNVKRQLSICNKWCRLSSWVASITYYLLERSDQWRLQLSISRILEMLAKVPRLGETSREVVAIRDKRVETIYQN